MREPTPDSLRLTALARGLVETVASRLPPVAALVTGSAAEGVSDEHSDLDLLFYYDELPDHGAFSRLLGEVETAIFEGPTGFADSYRLAGVEVQTGGTLLSHVNAVIDRVLSGEQPGEPGTKACSGIRHGLALYGEETVRQLQARVAEYPDGLRERAIRAGLRVFPIARHEAMLNARDTALFRRQVLVEGGLNLVLAWSALNRVYFTPFQFKRQRAHLAQLAIKPERAAERIDLLANGELSEAGRELQRLRDETLALVARHAPEVDIS